MGLHHCRLAGVHRTGQVGRPDACHLCSGIHFGHGGQRTDRAQGSITGAWYHTGWRVHICESAPVAVSAVSLGLKMELLNTMMMGFGVALEPYNLMWAVVGVFVGNLIGVLPGMGVLASISMLLPLTYTLTPTAA